MSFLPYILCAFYVIGAMLVIFSTVCVAGSMLVLGVPELEIWMGVLLEDEGEIEIQI